MKHVFPMFLNPGGAPGPSDFSINIDYCDVLLLVLKTEEFFIRDEPVLMVDEDVLLLL